jgi:hypothetical protein
MRDGAKLVRVQPMEKIAEAGCGFVSRARVDGWSEVVPGRDLLEGSRFAPASDAHGAHGRFEDG